MELECTDGVDIVRSEKVKKKKKSTILSKYTIIALHHFVLRYSVLHNLNLYVHRNEQPLL